MIPFSMKYLLLNRWRWLKAVKGEEEGEIKVKAPAPPPQLWSPHAEVMKILGYNESEVDYFQASICFVNVLTGVVEGHKDTVARQKLWHWMVKSLYGPRPVAGPYHYLVE